MQKVAVLLLLTVLLIGCSSSSRSPGPAPAPEQITPPGLSTVEPRTPPPAPAPIKVTPVDPSQYGLLIRYHPVGNAPLPSWEQGLVVDTCTPEGKGAPLQVKVLDLTWDSYPGLGDTFWAPAATLSICNPGEAMGGFDLMVTLSGAEAFAAEERVPIPRLEPGKGVPQFKLFFRAGVPRGLHAAMQAESLPWPQLSLAVSVGGLALPVNGRLSIPPGEKGQSTANWSLPAEPSLRVLQQSAWTGDHTVTSERSLTGKLDLFLYAPDLSYRIEALGACDHGEGITVTAEQWSLWGVGTDGGPRRQGYLGLFTFWSGQGWAVAERPQAKMNFLLLSQPPTCQLPARTTFYAYDTPAEQVHPMAIQTGNRTIQATVETPTLLPDGTLRIRDYERMGQTNTWRWVEYPWDRAQLTWLPPKEEPAGAATSPGGVYVKKP